MTAPGHFCLPIASEPLGEVDIVQPCNQCLNGSHLDRDHILGITIPEYQIVKCPICGRTGIRTRPSVKNAIHT